jgi:hypothetical protein
LTSDGDKIDLPATVIISAPLEMSIPMGAIENLQAILEQDITGGTLSECMQNIGIFQPRLQVTKLIQQYELFKLAQDRPGHIVELGVYRGESLLYWAHFLEMFNMGERITRVIGFDNFEGFTGDLTKDQTLRNKTEDGQFAIKPGGFDPGKRAYERLKQIIEVTEADHFVPHRPRLELVKGDIRETVPKYVTDNPGLRISLLLLDVDVYEPTLIGLKYLYPLVVAGGVVILDEYAQEKFVGESTAFDEYFGDKRPKVIKSHLNSNPSAYFIKDV